MTTRPAAPAARSDHRPADAFSYPVEPLLARAKALAPYLRERSARTEVIEALSYGDASVGWCAMIGADTGLYAMFLDEPVARAMFPHPT